MKKSGKQSVLIPRNNQFYKSSAFLFPALMFIPGRYIYRQARMPEIDWSLLFIGSIIVFLVLAYLLSQVFLRIINQKPALIIEKDGLTEQISMVRAGKIPWKQIQKVTIQKYTGQEQLLIYVRDPGSIIERQNYFKKNMAKQMLRDTGAVIAINPKMIKYDLNDLKSQIQRRIKKS